MPIVGYGFPHGIALNSDIAGPNSAFECPVEIFRALPVMRKQRNLLRRVRRQHLCDAAMERSPAGEKQAAVGGVLKQDVLKGVCRARAGSTPEHEPGIDQLIKPTVELMRLELRYGPK